MTQQQKDLEYRIRQQNAIYGWLLTGIGALLLIGVCLGMSIVWGGN